VVAVLQQQELELPFLHVDQEMVELVHLLTILVEVEQLEVFYF
jgi:hypothetical protein